MEEILTLQDAVYQCYLYAYNTIIQMIPAIQMIEGEF